MTPIQAYVLCTTPRSGSTLLCRMLAATGVAGAPKSYFHRPDLGDWAERFGLATPTEEDHDGIAALIEAARAAGMAGTGVFGLRLQAQSRAFFFRQLARRHPEATTDADRFRAEFGPTRFLYLRRADTIAQAVSLTRAKQTGLWRRAADGSDLEQIGPRGAPAYDGDAIARHVTALAEQNADWRRWFDANGVAPIEVDYDSLAADPVGALATLLEALGLDPQAAGAVKPDTTPLRDAESDAWIARFRAEHGG